MDDASEWQLHEPGKLSPTVRRRKVLELVDEDEDSDDDEPTDTLDLTGIIAATARAAALLAVEGECDGDDDEETPIVWRLAESALPPTEGRS